MRCIYMSEWERNIRVAAKFLHAARLFPKLVCFRNGFFKSNRENDLTKWKNHFQFFYGDVFVTTTREQSSDYCHRVSFPKVSNNRIYFGANQHTETTKVRTLRTVRSFADCATHRKSNYALTYWKWRVVSNGSMVYWMSNRALTYRKLRGVNNV